MAKKKLVSLDLSKVASKGGDDYVVQSYDYTELQTGKSLTEIQFDNDLEYLLAKPPKEADVKPKVAKRNKSTARKAMSPTPGKKQANKIKVSKKEITGDVNEISFSSDEEDAANGTTVTDDAAIQGEEPKKKKKERKPRHVKKTEDQPAVVEKELTPKTDSTEEAVEVDQVVPKPDATKKKRKRSKKKTNKDAVEVEAAPESKSEGPEDSDSKPPVTDRTPEADEKKVPKKADTPESIVLERPLRSSAAAVRSTFLPEIQPVKTIIGLSHEQIYRMRLTDVKFKTMLSVPNMSKTCSNVLKFVMKESEKLFLDSKKQSQFVKLCVLIALYESHGFHKVVSDFPELPKWLLTYDEVNLEHTRTNLTVSNKQIHQNNFDYSVLSYIGHILIWGNHLQTAGGVATIMGKFGLGISTKDIAASIGGYHLWDRLRRDNKTINTKRWKHIQKFRQIFAFEEDQFVLILRSMSLGVEVP